MQEHHLVRVDGSHLPGFRVQQPQSARADALDCRPSRHGDASHELHQSRSRYLMFPRHRFLNPPGEARRRVEELHLVVVPERLVFRQRHPDGVAARELQCRDRRPPPFLRRPVHPNSWLRNRRRHPAHGQAFYRAETCPGTPSRHTIPPSNSPPGTANRSEKVSNFRSPKVSSFRSPLTRRAELPLIRGCAGPSLGPFPRQTGSSASSWLPSSQEVRCPRTGATPCRSTSSAGW